MDIPPRVKWLWIRDTKECTINTPISDIPFFRVDCDRVVYIYNRYTSRLWDEKKRQKQKRRISIDVSYALVRDVPALV